MFLKRLKEFSEEYLTPDNLTCALCGIEIFGGRLCPDCESGIIKNDGATCPVCGRRTAVEEICLECKKEAPAFKKAVSPFVYSQKTVSLIAAFKRGKPFIKKYIAENMLPCLEKLPHVDCTVAVPLTKREFKKRGYNQSAEICRELERIASIPYLEGAAEKVKNTPAQKGLKRSEREKNLNSAFKADKKLLKGKTVLMVDDVITTGATLNALCRQIKKAGAAEVYAVCAASVEYHK